MGRRIVTIVVVVVLVVVLGRFALNSRSAPMPEPFASARSFVQATTDAKASGKPVLAFATADWCGPCKQLKRGSLGDAEVQAWIAANTHPVVLDCTESSPEAMRFGVTGIPALLLIRGEGEKASVVARTGGVLGKSELLRWLQENAK